MENKESCRLELVNASRIKRIPGVMSGANRDGVMKVKDFVKKRGYCNPVVLSDSDGFMTLLAGTAAFEACLEEKERKIPAVIVRTAGEADDLMFALQSAELDDTLGAIAAGAALVRLIDHHKITRKHIIETLGKSGAWLHRMERLSRSLNIEVQRMVADGLVSARSAQEIARLPTDVQAAFAISVSNDLLSKDNITYLVNRYLNKDISIEERARIVSSPKMALPSERKQRSRLSKDSSLSARLARAISVCLDSNAFLTNVLSYADIGEAAIRMADIEALIDSLTELRERLLSIFALGENEDGDAYD